MPSSRYASPTLFNSCPSEVVIGSRTLMDRKDRSAIILEPVFLLRPETVIV